MVGYWTDSLRSKYLIIITPEILLISYVQFPISGFPHLESVSYIEFLIWCMVNYLWVVPNAMPDYSRIFKSLCMKSWVKLNKDSIWRTLFSCWRSRSDISYQPQQLLFVVTQSIIQILTSYFNANLPKSHNVFQIQDFHIVNISFLGDGCADKPLSTLWKNYTGTDKPNIIMKVTVCASGKRTFRSLSLEAIHNKHICFQV